MAPDIMEAQTKIPISQKFVPTRSRNKNKDISWANVKFRNYCLWMLFYHKNKMEQEPENVLRKDSQEEC